MEAIRGKVFVPGQVKADLGPMEKAGSNWRATVLSCALASSQCAVADADVPHVG